MPTPAQSVDSLFDTAISQMTGGLVPDVNTALICMVGLVVIYVGFQLLVESLGVTMKERCRSDLKEQAGKDYSVYSDESGRFSQMDQDIAKARYRKAVNALSGVKDCK